MEELHSVLFQHNRMRSLAKLNKALVGRAGQLGEIGVSHVGRKIGVPFRVNEEGRHGDLSRIIERLSRAPIIGEFSGYAAGCTWTPKEREWDAVRLGVLAGRSYKGGTQPVDRVIQLRYVCERNHRPSADGVLQFNCTSAMWVEPHPNPRLQKMAECFLDSWMKKPG